MRPRSGAPWESGDGDLKLSGLLDYQIPLGVYDRPLIGPRPYKPALLGLGATVYAESALYADVDSGKVEPEDSIFFGLETEAHFTWLHIPFFAGAGAALRVDREFSETPKDDDWQFYLFVSSSPRTRTDAADGREVDRAPAAGWGDGGLPNGLIPTRDTVR
jgi:hypothetical protein